MRNFAFCILLYYKNRVIIKIELVDKNDEEVKKIKY